MHIGDKRVDAWGVEWVILGTAQIYGETLLLVQRVVREPGKPVEQRQIRSGEWAGWSTRRVSEPEGVPDRTALV